MFSHIKTSKENKEVVTSLTNILNLGAENVIARIALAHSLAKEEQLDLKNLKDSGGKEYSKTVLLGENEKIYLGMICLKYKVHISNKDIPKFVKAHLDEGLEFLHKKISSKNNETNLITLIQELN